MLSRWGGLWGLFVAKGHLLLDLATHRLGQLLYLVGNSCGLGRAYRELFGPVHGILLVRAAVLVKGETISA